MSLESIAAKLVLGIIDWVEVEREIGLALESGSSACLVEIAVSDHLYADDLKVLLKKFFNESGKKWPSKEQAIYQLIREHLNQIAHRQSNPRNVIRSLINDVLRPSGALATNNKYVGDRFGLEKLLAAFWSYEDIEENPERVTYGGKTGNDALEEIHSDLKKFSHEWLEEHQCN